MLSGYVPKVCVCAFIFNSYLILFLDYPGVSSGDIPIKILNSRHYKLQSNKELLLGNISLVINICKETFLLKA